MQALTKDLLKLWHKYISGYHHKDRDCHFYIDKTTKFSTYGEQEVNDGWRLRHEGYINNTEEYYNSFEEAEIGLQNFLIDNIRLGPKDQDYDKLMNLLKEILNKHKPESCRACGMNKMGAHCVVDDCSYRRFQV